MIKVLIISTYSVKCGIASFTEALKTHLDEEFHIDIAPLDQDFLKRFPMKYGDMEIDKIISKSKNYDIVNIQLEWGTLGSNQYSILKRFNMLLNGCNKIILTLHTPIYIHFNFRPFINNIKMFKLVSAFKSINNELIKYIFENKKLSIIKKTSSKLKDKFHIVVHTKREQKNLSRLHHIQYVHDHPLSNMHKDWLERIKSEGPAFRETLKHQFGLSSKLIGFFGFISPYKGIETAINAVRLLGNDYKLLIFGSIHPESIQKNTEINPYLGKILNEIGYTIKYSTEKKCKKNVFSENSISKPLENIFFMGSPDDFSFAKSIYAVDACIFPYLETGQSASGPVSLAIELQRPTFCTSTHTFIELEKYFPNNFAMFDIGNYVQLSQYIKNIDCYYSQHIKYNMSTQKDMYKRIILDII